MTVVIAPPAEKTTMSDAELDARLGDGFDGGETLRSAGARLAAQSGRSRRDVYDRALKRQRENEDPEEE